MSYTKEELNLLPQKIFDEFLEKKSKCIGFHVFLAASHNEKELKFRDWFTFCKRCDIKHIDSIKPIVKDKEEFTIIRLTEMVQEMFPDCLVQLQELTEKEMEEQEDLNGKHYRNPFEQKYRLYISWKEE